MIGVELDFSGVQNLRNDRDRPIDLLSLDHQRGGETDHRFMGIFAKNPPPLEFQAKVVGVAEWGGFFI